MDWVHYVLGYMVIFYMKLVYNIYARIMLFLVVANQCIYPLLVIDAISVQTGIDESQCNE